MATVVAATTALALASAAPVLAQTGDPGPASGNGVQPTFVAGNPTCAQLTDTDFLKEFKIEPVVDGTYPVTHDDLSGEVTLDVRDTADGPVVDFSFTGDFVTATVIVKGGPNANFYDYRPDGEDADTNLHAPLGAGPGGTKYFGLSHISFCIIEAPDETPTPTPTPTDTETPTPTPTKDGETPEPTPTKDGETPKPVPTSVPAGYGQADNGSASTIGLLAFVTALAVGGAALVTRRFLKDN